MAFAQAPRGQQAAAGGTMQVDRLCGVIGTTGIKAAVLPKKGADAQLVAAQQQQQRPFHCCAPPCRSGWNRRTTSERSAVFSAAVVAGPLLALTGLDRRTMQSSGGSMLCRNSSRVMRLMVLRVTARGAKRLATTTPRRACASALERVYSTKCAVRCTGRKRKTDENSSVLMMRLSRAKFCGLSPVTPAAGSAVRD